MGASTTRAHLRRSVGRVLKDEELAHENSSSESDSDGAGARVRKGADEKYKRFSAYSPAMNNMSDEDRRKLMRTPTCKEGESMDADERVRCCHCWVCWVWALPPPGPIGVCPALPPHVYPVYRLTLDCV